MSAVDEVRSICRLSAVGITPATQAANDVLADINAWSQLEKGTVNIADLLHQGADAAAPKHSSVASGKSAFATVDNEPINLEEIEALAIADLDGVPSPRKASNASKPTTTTTTSTTTTSTTTTTTTKPPPPAAAAPVPDEWDFDGVLSELADANAALEKDIKNLNY